MRGSVRLHGRLIISQARFNSWPRNKERSDAVLSKVEGPALYKAERLYFIMYFVYILLCNDSSFYTGISNNPQQRFQDHKDGKGGRYTRTHKPVKIIYLEKSGSKSDALKREAQIKGWSREKKIKILKLARK